MDRVGIDRVLSLLRRYSSRVRAGFVLFVLGKAAEVGGAGLEGALPAVATAVGVAMEICALVMVWSGLEGFMVATTAGFEENRGEEPPAEG